MRLVTAPLRPLLILAVAASSWTLPNPACQAQDTRPIEPSASKPRPDQPDKALEYFLAERLPQGRDIDLWERYEAAKHHMETMPRYSSRLGTHLPSAGEAGERPAPKAGQLESWANLGPGNFGGRTRAIVIDPDRPDIMYAAGVTGGVWKSLNAGLTWRPMTDLLPNITVSALAIDPTDPRTLYAGSGEGVFITGFRGAGIFKSRTSGRNWARLGSTLGPDFRFVNDIVLSPNNNRRLYAATRTGVFRSRNGGNTWVHILEAQESGGCLDLAIRTDLETDVLFASCGNREQASVYRHPNAEIGRAWETVLTESDMGRTSLAIAPSNQDVIYALSTSLGDTLFSQNYLNALHAVFRSDSGGAEGSWEATVRNNDPVFLNRFMLSRPSAAMAEECFGSQAGSNNFTGQGWYDNVIAVDPVDEDVVYVGGIDLFRSDDGGRNWGIISYWWFSPPSAHADHHAIVFHPRYDGVTNRKMYVGNDGGLWRTDNPRALKATGERAGCSPGNTRVSWTSLNNGYSVAQFYHGQPFPDGESYVGGTQDNGTLRGDDAGQLDGWRALVGGDGGYVAIDPKNPNVFFVETQGLNLLKTTNGGRTFRQVIDGIAEPPGGPLFIVPYAMDPRKATRLWLGGNFLWRTTDGAENWRRASSLIDNTGSVSAIAVSPKNPNRVVAGLDTGLVARNDQALKAERDTAWPATLLREGAAISWIAFDPQDDDVVYATSSTFDGKHVFKSVDGGASWAQIDGNGPRRLPNIPVHSILVDPKDSRRIFVGTDLGVFVSTSGGLRWAVEDNDFSHVIVQSMSIVERRDRTRYLFAFTHGRGAWRVELDD